MNYATEKDAAELMQAKVMVVEARRLRNRVQARLRKRKQRDQEQSNAK